MSSMHVYSLRCNGPGCRKVFPTLHERVIDARADAAKEGWTVRRIRSANNFYNVDDFCPDHDPKVTP